MLDMFRRKDKLLEAIERAIPIMSKAPIRDIANKPCRIVFMPMHWGLDGFMSPDQFKTFFWPQLRQVIMRFIDAGLVPLVLWEGDCTSRLETIADIPAGKAIYWFERTDMFRAKEVLGDIVCLRGNVPASLFVTAGPQEVRDYCRKLIEVAGKGGGLILDGAIGIPDEARTENVLAMYEAAREYGRYS
jgi:uroporphyrinogen-III decarboxylase